MATSTTPKTSFSFSEKDKHLVIVESPAKCSTISKYLGKNFTVMASYGHIAQLEKKNMGVDIENDYTPSYSIHPDKKKVVSSLKSAMKKVNHVRIATDEDREGEAIGRHVARALKLNIEQTPRITFHEITKPALEKAIQNPRTIDMNLVNAQQARRILDRLVGFELSPLLWKKVQSGLSAGRVQSVAVKLLVDKEREIQDFQSQETLQSTANFSSGKSKFSAKGTKKYKSLEKAKEFVQACSTAEYTIDSVQAKPSKKTPSAPFTTSTLQQEASRKLGFSVSQTMRVAQKLYESGNITYMRTDSIVMSGTAISSATKAIKQSFGEENVCVRKYKNKKSSAQEAHECIRPTNFATTSAGNDNYAQRLYRLIRQRSLAAQMIHAELEKTTVKISLSNHKDGFQAQGEVIKKPGFLLAYGIDGKSTLQDDDEEYDDKKNKKDQGLPPLEENQSLDLEKIEVLTNYSRHPSRYTEASLVKKMEAEGIGRPSTYAPTISTIVKRKYVVLEDRIGLPKDHHKLILEKTTNSSQKSYNSEISNANYGYLEEVIQKPYGAERKKLFPTDTGIVVTDFLSEHFPGIINYGFTAQVEGELDEVASQGRDRKSMMDSFYKPFHGLVIKAGGEAPRATGERILGTDPKTGRKISVRLGRYGPFVQLGESDDEDKKYASLKIGLRLENITLEEAISCFDLPRKLGLYNGEEVVVSIGRFGPYVRYGSLFASLKKEQDPYAISKEDCQILIDEKIQSNKEKLIHSFTHTDDTACRVEKGRYGPYIKYGKKNVKIPKEYKEKIESLSDQDRIQIIDESYSGVTKKPTKKTAKKSTKKTATSKSKKKTTKTTAKKKTSTKKT